MFLAGGRDPAEVGYHIPLRLFSISGTGGVTDIVICKESLIVQMSIPHWGGGRTKGNERGGEKVIRLVYALQFSCLNLTILSIPLLSDVLMRPQRPRYHMLTKQLPAQLLALFCIQDENGIRLQVYQDKCKKSFPILFHLLLFQSFVDFKIILSLHMHSALYCFLL